MDRKRKWTPRRVWTGPFACCPLMLLVGLLEAVSAQGTSTHQWLVSEVRRHSTVTLKPIQQDNAYSDSAAPDSIQYACSKDLQILISYFEAQNAIFQETLFRKQRNSVCHVWYQPSVMDYRAHAESDPIDEIVFTVDSRTFFMPPEYSLGNSLDIAKAVASRPYKSRVLRLRTKLELGQAAQKSAVLSHFGTESARVVVEGQPISDASVWTQDFMKSGTAGSQNVVLIPRHSFEGDQANGPKLDPLLTSMERPRWIRSKLSWDGGDLMLARDPNQLSKLILFYGDAAKNYWGSGLSTEEYGYVLMREFGADEAVYAGDIASHLDYALNFLPDGQTAVIAAPVTGKFALSRKALAMLTENHGNLPVLQELQRLHAAPDAMVLAAREPIRELLEEAIAAYPDWPRPIDLKALEDVSRYVSRFCPDDHTECTGTEGMEALLARDSSLARRWVTAASAALAGEHLPKALLGIVASQIAQPDQTRAQRLTKLKQTLLTRGFGVVDAPVIGGGRISQVRWAGISYVNFVALGQELLTPVFGLGEPELELLKRFQRGLPGANRVVAVYARAALSQNGGVHCVLGTRRSGWENGDWPSVISQGLPRWRITLPLRLPPSVTEE